MKEYKSYPVAVAKADDGYILTLRFTRHPDVIGEIWALESKNQLIDLNKVQLAAQWTRVNIGNDRKWSWDGMYEKTPSSYTPSGEDVYWRSPINYAANAFVMEDGSRAADDLGWLMLKTTLATQNADGYWESGPRSDWLWKDYHIDSGFYDTRFNTDHALALLRGSHAYSDADFLTASRRYADWLIRHADDEHVTIKGEKQEGWLIPDYSHPNPHKRAHTSLNHQLAEMNYLLEMYLETKDEKYRTYAEKLLYGIKNTRSIWIKPNGDLNYAYEDGKGIKADYPILTYNDLWEAQRLLKALKGSTDPDLADLMASKKKWMDKNKIEGYNTRPL
jgi:hypothetical protein